MRGLDRRWRRCAPSEYSSANTRRRRALPATIHASALFRTLVRRDTRRSLRRRLATAFVAFAVACAGLGLMVAFLGAVLPHRQELDAALLTRASELLERDDESGSAGLVEEIERRCRESGEQGWQYACWSVGTGTLLAGNAAPLPETVGTG